MVKRLALSRRCFFVLNLLFVAIVMVISGWKKPIWLDENYSLFFAKTFSPSQLLFQFTADSHPGLYYFFLKYLLLVTHNLFLLRLVSSAIPALIGLSTLFYLSIKNKQQRFLRLVAPVIFLNPLLLDLSSQLRMYGFVIMFSCFFYVFWEQWLTTKRKNFLYLLVANLLLAGLFHYAFILLSIPIFLILIFHQQKEIKTRSLAIFLFLSSLLEIGLTSGFAAKEKLIQVAWIPTPNLANISSVYSTLIGIQNDFFSTHVQFTWYDALFDLLLFLAGIFLLRFLWRKKSTWHQILDHQLTPVWSLLCFSILPLLMILIGSWLMPVLSQLPFFYHFVPNASLFIPRSQIIFLILGLLLGFRKLFEWSQRNELTPLYAFIVISVGIVWFINTTRFVLLDTNSSSASSEYLQTISSQNQQLLLFPSWLWIETITPNTLDIAKLVANKMTASKQLETNLQATSQICSIVKGKTVVQLQKISTQLAWESQTIERQLLTCCENKQLGAGFNQWSCR